MASEEAPTEATTVTMEDRKLNGQLTLEFRNVTFRRRDKGDKRFKTILNGVSGKFLPGRLTAILGPSGAGKSSLLNILSGFQKTGVIGTLEINGEVIDERRFRQQCVYIPQDFDLIEHLTVLETMDFAAELKMRRSRSSMVKQKKVNDILKVLGLDKNVGTLVKNLSGGEKKRLSIGVEMVCNPPIILLDEPTSGLDSVAAMQLMCFVKSLAVEGRTIVSVIHQPSSSLFRLFDDVFLLSAGCCIFTGSIDTMVPTLAEAGFNCPKFYNRADFALEVASQTNAQTDYLVLQFSKITANRTVIAEENTNESSAMMSPYKGTSVTIDTTSRYQIPQWKQFLVLLRRSLKVTSRDFFFARLRVIAHIVVGFLIGLVFYKAGVDASLVMTNAACIFFFLLFIFFGNSMPCVITFSSEVKIFVRERLNNWYSLEAYYLSKIIADLPLQLICPTAFLLIGYFMTGQPLEYERFVMLWFMCLLLGIFAQALGLMASAAFDVKMATFFVPCFSIPSLLFSGFFIKSYEMLEFLRPLSYASFFRYSFHGSLQAIYGYNRTDFPCSEIVCYFNKPKKFLQFIDASEDGFVTNVYTMLGCIAILQVLLYIVLRQRLKIYQ